jgi:hypothetical protein
VALDLLKEMSQILPCLWLSLAKVNSNSLMYLHLCRIRIQRRLEYLACLGFFKAMMDQNLRQIEFCAGMLVHQSRDVEMSIRSQSNLVPGTCVCKIVLHKKSVLYEITFDAVLCKKCSHIEAMEIKNLH